MYQFLFSCLTKETQLDIQIEELFMNSHSIVIASGSNLASHKTPTL